MKWNLSAHIASANIKKKVERNYFLKKYLLQKKTLFDRGGSGMEVEEAELDGWTEALVVISQGFLRLEEESVMV